MRNLIAYIIMGFSCVLCAQQVVMPSSSKNDGVNTQSAGANLGTAYWGNPAGLASYAVSGDGYQDPVTPGAADSHLGLVWTTSAPTAFDNAVQQLNSTGGTVRVIFVGESAGWWNSFGYTYDGDPSGAHSFTAWKEIETTGSHANISFGNYFDLHLAQGGLSNLDFWFSASGTPGYSPTNKTYLGGIYTLLHNSSPQSLWASQSVQVDTASASGSQKVSTYMVSFEDWRLNSGADADYSDLRLAFQFFNPDGSALIEIPEPATAAAIFGALAFVFAVLLRAAGHIRRTPRSDESTTRKPMANVTPI